MAEHCPTPWSYSPTDKLNPDRAFGIVRELTAAEVGNEDEDGGGTEVIAEVCAGPTAEADAAFICRACNSHEAVLAALALFVAYYDNETDDGIELEHVYERCCAALKKGDGA